jgi:hypothetical protein
VKNSAMTEEPRKNTKTQLALAIAQGVPVAAWARANGVSRRTAFNWAKNPLVRKTVESCRRRTIDQAIGKMTKHTTRAVDIILSIANQAKSDSVRLRAARAIFSDMITVSDHSELEFRMTEIEEQLEQRADAGNSTVASWSPTNYGHAATPDARLPVTSIATGPG